MNAGMNRISIARGLSYGLIETWTKAAHELSDALFRGELDAEGLIRLMQKTITATTADMRVFRLQLDGFDGLVKELNKQ